MGDRAQRSKGGEGASAPASSNKQGIHAKCPLSDFSPCPSKTICTSNQNQKQNLSFSLLMCVMWSEARSQRRITHTLLTCSSNLRGVLLSTVTSVSRSCGDNYQLLQYMRSHHRKIIMHDCFQGCRLLHLLMGGEWPRS